MRPPLNPEATGRKEDDEFVGERRHSVQIDHITGLTINPNIVFTDHQGKYHKQIEKRQRKLLYKAAFLRNFLWQGEVVLKVTTGCSPISPAEHLLSGLIIFHTKRALFLITNMRIIHVPVKGNNEHRHSLSQILWGDCKETKVGMGDLKVTYRDGSPESFMGFGDADRKAVKELLKSYPFARYESTTGRRSSICPQCAAELTRGRFDCGSCDLQFKTPMSMLIRSLLPGGSFFFTGQPGMGLLFGAIEVVMIMGLLGFGFLAEDETLSQTDRIVMCAAFLIVFKVLSIFHSRHRLNEFLPINRNIEVIPVEPEPEPEDDVYEAVELVDEE